MPQEPILTLMAATRRSMSSLPSCVRKERSSVRRSLVMMLMSSSLDRFLSGEASLIVFVISGV